MTSYSLLQSYAGQSLIQGFDFISTNDSSHGFVSYQDYDSALAQGLVSVNANNQVILAADTTNTYNPDGSQGGRPSVRIESKASFNQVLVIGDFAHMPGSVCGAWPSFWMYGPNWPNDGELDIIEGANMAYQNLVSAHTSTGCDLPSTGAWTGIQELHDCSVTDGCNYVPPSTDTSSYGDSFNAIGGGVYALLWEETTLQVWHFPRGSVPPDVDSQSPDPSGWGTPQALFGTSSCDIEEHFADMTIVLDLDFCGDYAGNTWGTGSCAGYATTCEDWVGNNVAELTNLYWEVNYINVFRPTTAVPSSSAVGEHSTAAAQSSILPRVSTSAVGKATSTAALGHPVGSNGAASSSKASSRAASASASASPSAGSNPANINSFAYLGCFSSTSEYSGFTLSGTNAKMTLEGCTDICSSSKYAAIVNTHCYCANNLDAGTSSVPNRASCNTPCPGNSAEYCGSLSAGLRSLYISSNAVNSTTPPPAPAMAGNATGSSEPEGSPTTAADGASQGQGQGSQGEGSQGEGSQGGASQVAATTKVATATALTTNGVKTITLTSEVIYTTICSTNPAHLVPVTTTVTYCPTDPSDPSVPQSMVTQSCNGCGVNGQSVVTLTIPLALVDSQPSSSAISPVDPPASSQTISPVSSILQATAMFPVNGSSATGIATWAPVATPTFPVPVQVASAPKMSEWNVVLTTIVASIYAAIVLV